MIRLIYSRTHKIIKRMPVTANEYLNETLGIDTGATKIDWESIDYKEFKKWLCDKYNFVYEAVDWTVC